MNPPQQLGQKIRDAAKAKGISLNKLARSADMPRNHLTSILKGDTQNPGVYTIGRLASTLGVSIDSLVFADGHAERNS